MNAEIIHEVILMKGVSKTVIAVAGIIIVVLAAILAYYALTPPAPYKITIYTGGTGGVYYPLGVKLADLLNKHAGDKITASASSSGASVANARALGAGDANLIFIQNDIAYYAYNGLYMFSEGKIEKIRGLATLYPEIIQIIVRADSGIKTINDLEGKRVAIGAAGSGTAVEAEIILKAAGVWDKITIQNLDFTQAAQALKLGQVDAAFVVAGIPTSAVMELAATTPVSLVEIPDTLLNTLKQQGYLFFVQHTVPKETYTGLDKDVKTLAVRAMLAISSDVPDDIAYTILKVMFDNIDELRQAHARAQDISINKALEGLPIKLHPGAVKYYQDKGITIPQELKP
ncbi:MAG: TAXI family TRAP transporter solute-binding subunit [Zestosphaera sp.]